MLCETPNIQAQRPCGQRCPKDVEHAARTDCGKLGLNGAKVPGRYPQRTQLSTPEYESSRLCVYDVENLDKLPTVYSVIQEVIKRQVRRVFHISTAPTMTLTLYIDNTI